VTKLARSGRSPTQRQLKAGEVIRHALVQSLQRGDIHDPDLDGVSITVSEVRISPDLKRAVAFVMPLMGQNKDGVLTGLRRSRNFIRGIIARATTWKFVPEIDFELDRSFEQSERVDQLLNSKRVRRDLSQD
jgi:ribosome-binding factor A